MKKRILALVLALSLLLTACGGNNKASAMNLIKTEGTVGVRDEGGKDVKLRDMLKLYSGYGVSTQTESYAWIDLDSVKLAKLDEDSAVSIRNDSKNLEIILTGGSVFFNVTEPLAEDETMTIRSSTMAVGIRGTSGWVSEEAVYILNGTVTVTAGTESVSVSAGEMAELLDGNLTVRTFSRGNIPGFVQTELDEAADAAPGDALVLTLPVTGDELREGWEKASTIIIRPGTESTLYVTSGSYWAVGEGRRLILDEGVQMDIAETTFHLSGTLEAAGDIMNRGILDIESGGLLKTAGDIDIVSQGHLDIFEGSLLEVGGTITNEANSYFDNKGECAAGAIESHGRFSNAGMIDQLVVQTGGEMFLGAGGYLRELDATGTNIMTFAGTRLDRITIHDSFLNLDGSSTDPVRAGTIEQYGDESSTGLGICQVDAITIYGGNAGASYAQIGEVTFNSDGYFNMIHANSLDPNVPMAHIGVFTQGAGDTDLRIGSIDSFVLNGGRAYVAEVLQIGSITHNGGQLIDNRS